MQHARYERARAELRAQRMRACCFALMRVAILRCCCFSSLERYARIFTLRDAVIMLPLAAPMLRHTLILLSFKDSLPLRHAADAADASPPCATFR